MSKLIEKKIGDEVYIDCFSSMGSSSCGDIKITDVVIKYDSDTGEPFNVIITDEDAWDSRTGLNYTNPNYMYYIE